MKWTDLSIDVILNLYSANNYIVVDKILFANVFGVRSKGGYTNTFDDQICILRKNYADVWESLICSGTTDPGKYWLENPENVHGTAILKPGQHRASHKVGLHKGEYRALVQNAPLPVWRDSNKTDSYDHTSDDYGIFGINIHRANPDATSTEINKWSAGCQVMCNPLEFKEFMNEVDDHIAQGYGDVFTYTLFEEI